MPVHARSSAVKNFRYGNLLVLAIGEHIPIEWLEPLLSLVPEEERFDIVTQTTGEESVIYTAAADLETLRTILLSLPETRRYEALQVVVCDQYCAIDKVVENGLSSGILDLLPQDALDKLGPVLIKPELFITLPTQTFEPRPSSPTISKSYAFFGAVQAPNSVDLAQRFNELMREVYVGSNDSFMLKIIKFLDGMALGEGFPGELLHQLAQNRKEKLNWEKKLKKDDIIEVTLSNQIGEIIASEDFAYNSKRLKELIQLLETEANQNSMACPP